SPPLISASAIRGQGRNYLFHSSMSRDCLLSRAASLLPLHRGTSSIRLRAPRVCARARSLRLALSSRTLRTEKAFERRGGFAWSLLREKMTALERLTFDATVAPRAP